MRMTERNSENRKIFDVANARRVRLALLAYVEHKTGETQQL